MFIEKELAVKLKRLLVAVIAFIVFVPSSASAQDRFVSDCPEITDSVKRLFIAYFNRDPLVGEIANLSQSYSSGETSLEEISNAMANSQEFTNTYGILNDTEFVNFVYQTTDTRIDADTQTWTKVLNAGHDRGSVILAFTESEKFVKSTGTSTPLAGYLNWYPEGTQWYCGSGSRTISGQEFKGNVFADYFLSNADVNANTNTNISVDNNGNEIVIGTSFLQSRYSEYVWDGKFTGDGDYGNRISIRSSDNTRWIVVIYPKSLGKNRLGWQIS